MRKKRSYTGRAVFARQISISLTSDELDFIETTRGELNRSKFITLAATGKLPSLFLARGTNFRILCTIGDYSTLISVLGTHVEKSSGTLKIQNLTNTTESSVVKVVIDGLAPNLDSLHSIVKEITGDKIQGSLKSIIFEAPL
jgi:hypothetical protein